MQFYLIKKWLYAVMKNETEVMAEIGGIKDFLKESIDKYFHPQEIKRKNYQKIEIKTCEDSPVFF